MTKDQLSPDCGRRQTALAEHEHRKRWKGLHMCHETTLMTKKQRERKNCWRCPCL